jgi:hypothetical protein
VVDEPIKGDKERSSDDYIGEQDREWLADASVRRSNGGVLLR